ncbi:hypothetical protein INR49_007615 [Caranx melampygus]|nr:hypothetical protein INR49_007615 [Caranx melampygus]
MFWTESEVIMRIMEEGVRMRKRGGQRRRSSTLVVVVMMVMMMSLLLRPHLHLRLHWLLTHCHWRPHFQPPPPPAPRPPGAY